MFNFSLKRSDPEMRKSTLCLSLLILFTALTLLATPSFAQPYKCTRTLPYTRNTITFPPNNTITGDLDVPVGETCELHYIIVTGNVTVEGTLTSFNSTFQGNVTDNGGQISFINGNVVDGNLTFGGSPYYNQISCPNITNGNVIGGNLTVVGNTGDFYVCQAIVGHFDANNNVVGGNVVVSDNAGRVDIGGIAPLANNLVCRDNARLAPNQPAQCY
jgi:hypothetical protein